MVKQKGERKKGLNELRDSISLYMEQIEYTDLLTREDEIELAKRIEKGDLSARDKMIESNVRLVISEAKKFYGKHLDFLDLVQEGNVGLIKAVDSFDYRKGNRFSTYAVWVIRQGIFTALSDKERIVRLPRDKSSDVNKLNRVKRELRDNTMGEPSKRDLARETGFSETYIDLLEKISASVASLDIKVGDKEDTTLGFFIEDTKSAKVEDIIIHQNLKKELDDLLSILTVREEFVVRLRCGMVNDRVYTYREIGKKLGVSHERIRQIYLKSIRKLKGSRQRKRLNDFIR